MKTNKIIIAAALSTIPFLQMSCACESQCGSKTKSCPKTEMTQSKAVESNADISVDDLLANADNYINKEVSIEAICTHICKHGGRKIFLMGSDDTKTIRIEGGKVGKFDQKCVNSILNVKGILKEERIGEEYLQKWETRLANKVTDKHGDGEAGCSTEKKARGETATTEEARINDFRSKIEKRFSETGKNYLSFYFVEATSYEIK